MGVFPDGYAGEATFQRLELKFASKLRELSMDNRALRKQVRYTQRTKSIDYLSFISLVYYMFHVFKRNNITWWYPCSAWLGQS